MKTAYAYIRVSHKNQVEFGGSLEAQVDLIQKYCEMFGLKLVKTFSDKGISGRTIDKRPGFQQMLSELEEGKADVLVIPKLDRAFRNTKDAIETATFLEKVNVEFHSVREKIDTSSAMGKFFFQTMSALAELESNTISERIKTVQDHRRREGKRVGQRIPFGYKLGENDKLLPEETEQKALRIIVDNYGAISADSIATQLQKLGLKHRNGRAFTRHHVRNIYKANEERQTKIFKASLQGE